MTTSTILALSALAVVLASIAVLLCSAHIPGLNVLTGAAPLQAEEPEPYTAATEASDYLASLSLGFTEDPEAFATRIAARDRARYTPALLAITDTDTRIPTQTRKEQS